MIAEDMVGKKLRGSGGYAIARVTDEEQKKANLGGPELFLAGIGRLDQDRFEKYYCNKCEAEYEGAPALTYDNPNEELGEGVVLAEKGEYRCKTCNTPIAQYRKFETSSLQQAQSASNTTDSSTSQALDIPEVAASQIEVQTKVDSDTGSTVPIQSLVGMDSYDSNAMHLGKIELVGLKKVLGGGQITIRVNGRDLAWDSISKIGDIILLKQESPSSTQNETRNTNSSHQGQGKCPACGFQNDPDSVYCADCGSKI